MDLDVDCLLEARVENVERLARALGIRLPPPKGDRRSYARKLAFAVLKRLNDERSGRIAPSKGYVRTDARHRPRWVS